MNQKKCKTKLKYPKGKCVSVNCENTFPVSNRGRKRKLCDDCRKQRKQDYDINYQRKRYKSDRTARLISKENKTEKERLRLLGLMKESIKELEVELESESKILKQDKSAYDMAREGERCAPEQAKFRDKLKEVRIKELVHKEVKKLLPRILGIKKS